MSNSGFRLSRLIVAGKALPDADIPFERGFNVLTGPSNTGKSFILECIDYMLGADEPPGEDIDERKGYDTVFLELSTPAGTVYTLERSLLGGDVKLYNGSYAHRGHAAPRVLAIETQTKKIETLSAFLLSLCGIQNVQVRTNASGAKGNLTFRMISHLFLIDETNIIAKKKSPVRLASGYAKTPSERAFNYLITGEDDHSIISLPDPKETQAHTAGKKELYDELIESLESKIKDVPFDELTTRLSALENNIAEAVNSLNEKAGTIHQYQLARQTAFDQQHTAESRLIVIGELLTRFRVLKEHYTSDLERLEFISEGDYYFDQLVSMRCPVCGSSLEEHATQKLCNENQPALNDVQQACRTEADKIRVHLSDLEQTIGGLEIERTSVRQLSRAGRDEVVRVDKFLARELKPTFETEKNNLEVLIERRRELADLKSSFSSLAEYKSARAALDEADKPQKMKFAPTSAKATRALSDVIQGLLRDWKFLDGGDVVEFNESKMDMVVAGKHRRSNGKGLRGFLHGAFSLGLMRYCRANDLPHPGFVVLDSPITSYREGRLDEAEDEASPEVQAAFWDNLAKWTKDEQIVLIENKEPTEAARQLGHYVHFFGAKSTQGRKGFFPRG